MAYNMREKPTKKNMNYYNYHDAFLHIYMSSRKLLQHGWELDADQIVTILVLELPLDDETEARVPGGDRKLNIVRVLGADLQGAGGFDMSGFAGFAVRDGEWNGESSDDSVNVGVDGRCSGGSLEFDDHGGIFSLGKKTRRFGAAVDVDRSQRRLRTAIPVRRACIDSGQKAKKDDDGHHDFFLVEFVFLFDFCRGSNDGCSR